MLKHLLFVASLALAYPAYASPAECGPFEGAKIIAQDGTFLGVLADKYDVNSIFNKYGTYGNKYNPKSIWNKYGDYGSKYSSKSSFNEYANEPPMIISGGSIIARLTKNKRAAGAIDPVILSVICFDYTPD